MSLELISVYPVVGAPESEWARRKAFADLQVVSDETAKGTWCLLNRQLRSLGCPEMMRKQSAQEQVPSDLVRSFLYTSDGGSDQQRFKKLASTALHGDKKAFFLNFSCLMHSCQLIVKTSLNVADAWLRKSGIDLKYFPTLAKISYSWRDSTKAVYKT